MFGNFSIRCNDALLESNFGRMQQVWNFFEYLLVHRKESVSQSTLIEVLWPDEQSDNPSNALKNLAYRLRTLLASAFPDEDRPFIVYHRGSYSWNSHIGCMLDTEAFEIAVKRSSQQGITPEEKSELLNEAIDLYVGMLLPRSTREQWVVPLRTYYHYMFLQAVDAAAALLFERNQYEQIISICEKAIALEPYEEHLHGLLIQALASANRHTAALDHYYRVTNMFYNDLGIKVSSEITKLYNQIAKSVSHVEADLGVIEENLRNTAKHKGAYYCDYETFKSIYCSQSCMIARSGHSLFAVLLTISDYNGAVPSTNILTAAMETLKTVICGSLRKSDIVTRFSPTQYILLLSYLTSENCDMVLKRILTRFSQEYRLPTVKIHTTHCPVVPVS